MRLNFLYADTADISLWRQYEPVPAPFQLPDQALQLPECRTIVLDIAECVGKLTDAMLYITCKDLDLINHPIKLEYTGATRSRVEHSYRHLVLHFVQYASYRKLYRDLRIIDPVDPQGRVPDYFYLAPYGTRKARAAAAKRWNSLSNWEPQTAEAIEYAESISRIAQNCLLLLNTEPLQSGVYAPSSFAAPWVFEGFHPFRKHEAAIKRAERRGKERRAEQRKQAKEAEKQKAREAKLAQRQKDLAANGTTAALPEPKTGAGRRVGAVPGIFKGVMFRSQLEIRFVTQLEAKGIRWVYEGERLGKGQYLVDFYLPDLRCWVEVKGRIEPRDDYLLKDVAKYLKERDESIFVYTQSKAYKVSSRLFTKMTHQAFWAALEKYT